MTRRALIFDFDGLMVDSERVLAECFIEVLADFGATIGFEDFGHLFGTVDADDEWQRLVHDWCGRPVPMSDIEERLTPMYRQRGAELPLLPGVAELIDEATDAGWRVGLGTGQDRDRLGPKLERLGLVGRFHAVVTRQEVQRGKPFPDIFLEVAQRLEVDPTACLVLEDSVHGCEAAVAAGMRVIACPSVVTAHCEYPEGIDRVTSLRDVRIAAYLP